MPRFRPPAPPPGGGSGRWRSTTPFLADRARTQISPPVLYTSCCGEINDDHLRPLWRGFRRRRVGGPIPPVLLRQMQIRISRRAPFHARRNRSDAEVPRLRRELLVRVEDETVASVSVVPTDTANAMKKTHCPAGHPYSVENTGVTREGWRWCRKCHRDRERKRHKRKYVWNAVKVECNRGHPFDVENTYIRPGGRRTCRTCQRERRKRKDDE